MVYSICDSCGKKLDIIEDEISKVESNSDGDDLYCCRECIS